MTDGWLLDVLEDLETFCRDNRLLKTAEQLEVSRVAFIAETNDSILQSHKIPSVKIGTH